MLLTMLLNNRYFCPTLRFNLGTSLDIISKFIHFDINGTMFEVVVKY